MEQQMEQLQPEVVESLKKIQEEQNNMVIALGQVAVRRRDLQKQLDELAQKEMEFGQRLDNSLEKMNTELGELDKKYPNGQIDLEKGVVYF
jgi:aromatic ring-opening dioxygenase catalytic subunit (LigB family)